jgi:hypothetical protein
LDRLPQANYFDITETYQTGGYVSTDKTDKKFKEAVQYGLGKMERIM